MPETVVTSEAPLQLATTIGVQGILDAARSQAGDADKKLIEMLESVHPHYEDNVNMWRANADVALGRISSFGEKKRYLIQGDAEDDKHFNKRAALSAFLPETPGLLSDFVGAVFSKPARREFKKDEDREPAADLRISNLQERIMRFRDEAGEEGRPITQVMEQMTRWALVYGSCDAMLDHPAPAEEPTDVPRIALYTPLDRLDWQEGADGNFAWVKYRESRTVKAGWDKGRFEVQEYRIITAPTDEEPGMLMTFQVVELNKRKQVFSSEPIIHAFPSIPIRTLYWNKLASGIGDPWVQPLVEADLKILRQESDLTWDAFVHAHPWILAWLNARVDGKNPLSVIRLGSEWATHLDPGGEERPREDIQYLALNTAELDVQARLAEASREQARKLAGNGFDSTQKNMAPESGVAIAYRVAQRAKNFIQMSRALQETEWLITELVASEGADEFVDLSGVLEIVYPDKFDQRLTDELHADFDSTERIGSPTARKEVAKKLAVKLVGDGASQDLIDKINAEIEASGVTPEEGEEPVIEGEPAAAPTPEEATAPDLNEITLGIERLARIGDIASANILRRALAKMLGVPPPKDLTEQDIVSFKQETAPKQRGGRPAEVLE